MRRILPAVFAGACLVASCTPSTSPADGSGGGGGGTPSVADHLGMKVQPTLVDLGSVMTPALQVSVRDVGGSTLTSSNVDSISVTVTPNTGSVLGQQIHGTTTRAVINGVATFNDLTFTLEGTGFTLTFSAIGTAGVTDAISSAFDVTNNSNFVYFSSNRTGSFEVWRMKDDGTQQTQVTSRAMASDPTPAKNSAINLIAFSDGAAGIQALYTMNGDGTGIRQVQTHSDAGQASWSPDGVTIASRVAAGAPSFGLFTIRGDGTQRTQLGGGVEDYPSWNQTSDKISFTVDYLKLEQTGASGGGGTVIVQEDTTSQLKDAVSDSFPGWVSDTGFIPFTYGQTFILQSAWSPDGMRIAFVIQSYGKRHIFAISNLGAGVVVALTNKSSANDVAPTWSPDGTKIYFQSDRSGTNQIWSMNADGSGLTQLTNTGQSFSPSWWN
jgi:Tol biopolymer transport system component